MNYYLYVNSDYDTFAYIFNNISNEYSLLKKLSDTLIIIIINHE